MSSKNHAHNRRYATTVIMYNLGGNRPWITCRCIEETSVFPKHNYLKCTISIGDIITMAISRLNDALEGLMATGKPGDRVFARERGTGGSSSREYVIMTPEDAWNETIGEKQPHLYEVWPWHS